MGEDDTFEEEGERDTGFKLNSGVDRGINEKDAEVFRKKFNENIAYDKLVSSSPHLLKSVAFAALGDAELRKSERFKVVAEEAYGDLQTDIKGDQDGAKKISSSELVATFVEKVKERYQKSIEESQAQALAYMSGEKFVSMQRELYERFKEKYINGMDSIQKVVRIEGASGGLDPVLAEAEVEGGELHGISATEFWGKYKEIAKAPHETVLGLEIVPTVDNDVSGFYYGRPKQAGILDLEDLGLPTSPIIMVADPTNPKTHFINGESNRSSWKEGRHHILMDRDRRLNIDGNSIPIGGECSFGENGLGELVMAAPYESPNGEIKNIAFLVTGAAFVISKIEDGREIQKGSSPTI